MDQEAQVQKLENVEEATQMEQPKMVGLIGDISSERICLPDKK